MSPTGVSAFADRPNGRTLVLFDIDETLTPARRDVSPEMHDMLQQLRKKVVIGYVSGSNLAKQQEQLCVRGDTSKVTDMFDYCFAENGLTAFKLGKEIASQSFIGWIGEEKYKKLANFVLHYIADLDIPVKRGTFIEFRNGMINISPIGRNASNQERLDFEKYDETHNIRKPFVEALRKEFADFGLTFSIGGQISFDVFPSGWDKTYALRHVENEGFEEIHFFGDKTYEGGNDYEIFEDSRTIGHAIKNPQDTLETCKKLFLS